VSFDNDATEVSPRAGVSPVEQATPTEIDPTGDLVAPPAHARRTQRSEPIRVISMKADTDARQARAEAQRVPLHVQLRSMGEAARRHDTPVGLGHLAPPRDPQQARVRRARRYLLRAGVAIALAAAIALAMWFIAG